MSQVPKRLLVVDDNADIHRDFEKLMGRVAGNDGALAELEGALFGASLGSTRQIGEYELTSAAGGQQAVRLAKHAHLVRRPFDIAIVDMRMPDWDGLETIKQLWLVEPELEVAICSAYMDYSWAEVIRELKRPGVRFIRKPWKASDVLNVLHELRTRIDNRAVSFASG